MTTPDKPPAWEPIETAPKDGSKILLLGAAGEREVGYWFPQGDSWADENGNPCPAGSGTIQVTGCWVSCGAWFQPNEVIGWTSIPDVPGTTE